MKAVETPTQGDKVVSEAESLHASKAHPGKESELTRLPDEPSRERRGLPWNRIEKNYVSDGPREKETLADLSDGLSQLIVYRFICGPGWEESARAASSTPIILTAPWLI